MTVKLDLTGVNRIRRQLEGLRQSKVDVGFLNSKPHPEEPAGLNLPSIALIQEYGAPLANIPARPFLSESFRTTKAWRLMRQVLQLVFRGVNTDLRFAMFDRLGRFMAKEVSENIRDWSEPANAPSTVAKKGFNDPLVETGFMRDNVEHRVRK